MAGIKSLAKDTAVYGLSSIIGRFLNWLLVPLYTNIFPAEEYGVVTYLYAIVAIALVILTYGMETGFFRFSNHSDYLTDPKEVYSTTLISLATSSIAFLVLLLLFIHPVAAAVGCADHASYVWLLAAAVAIDAFTAIPFSYLRNNHRPVRFATLKLINIGLNIGLNIFFIVLCPIFAKSIPASIDWFYNPDYGIGYIFLANFISSAITLLMLMPELRGFKWRFNASLWRRMIRYSFPLLVLGVAGIMNSSLGTIMLPMLVADKDSADLMLGLYGANYKIAIVMVMFIQAFRFAYEPFIFSQSSRQGESRLQSYSDAIKYFVIFAMFIFLGVVFFIDILRYFIAPSYWAGLAVVPVLMIAEFFFGIFFNLSLWYKLTDRTIWGTWFSLMGLGVTIVMNILLVPRIGFMGCAWAAFACYGIMMVASYFVGQHYYPIPYDLIRISCYLMAALTLWLLAKIATTDMAWFNYLLRAVLLTGYICAAVIAEKIPVPGLSRFLRRQS